MRNAELRGVKQQKQSKQRESCSTIHTALYHIASHRFAQPVAHSPMDPAALEAKDIAETHRRPLRVLHAAVAARRVARQGLDNRLVARGHLHHGAAV
jgi:hypothetical protein